MRMLIPSLLLVFLAGCGSPKLNFEKLWEADNAGTVIELDPVKADQKITATATATGGKIDVYIFLAKNRDRAEKELLAKKLTGGSILASSEGTDSATLQATIPARESGAVMVRSSTLKKVSTKLKITN